MNIGCLRDVFQRVQVFSRQKKISLIIWIIKFLHGYLETGETNDVVAYWTISK